MIVGHIPWVSSTRLGSVCLARLPQLPAFDRVGKRQRYRQDHRTFQQHDTIDIFGLVGRTSSQPFFVHSSFLSLLHELGNFRSCLTSDMCDIVVDLGRLRLSCLAMAPCCELAYSPQDEVHQATRERCWTRPMKERSSWWWLNIFVRVTFSLAQSF